MTVMHGQRHKNNFMKVFTMAEMMASGEQPEILFWVGCAGSFDQRAQKITKAFATILNKAGVKYAILGKEEACTGDPARRAGNEFMFQMMAYQNIQILNGYNIKKIVTTCPHCFNTLKNEYPILGGNYDVIHHTQFLQELIEQGKIKFKDTKIMVLDEADRDTHSCGSFFTNPIVSAQFARTLPLDAPAWPMDDDAERVKLSAAWLIEQSGVKKGLQLGDSKADISTKHALAITNRGGASAKEVAELARFIQERVAATFGINLIPEPSFIGF